MKMHNGHDHNHVFLDAEEDAEGKGACQATTHIVVNHWVEGRVEFNPVEGVLYTGEEAFAEVRLLGLVPSRSLDHLGFGIRVKTELFHPNDVYAFANTSAAARSSISPSSTSRQRFWISSRHAAESSVPGAASRLSIKRSATKARA